MNGRRICVGVVLGLSLAVSACAGGGGVDASKSRSQGVIQSGGVVSSQEVRVAEYLNHYEQKFPSPVGSTLGLDLRLGNAQLPADGGVAWLQIGIQARSAENDVVAPLNLAIVIDRSGSMNTSDKMPYLKQSLRVFLKSLAANDIVSLVGFNDRAEVLAPATRVGDGGWIDTAVERLQPSGSTNLHEGLTTGFSEVDRNFDVRRNNRVILLTDGVANVGTTDPQQIASAARAFNDKGIYLSTIGLGTEEFNDKLLITLANQGKGAYHFVDSAAEMDRIFRSEVEGLYQKAASDLSLVVRPEGTVTIDSLTGYEGKPPAGTVQIRLRDMGTGDSQVVLAGLRLGQGQAGRRPIATVELRYNDLFSKKEGVTSKSIGAEAVRLSNYDPLWDVEVLRNVTIQRSAEGLKEIDRLYKSGQAQAAWELAYGLEQDLRNVSRLAGDNQLSKDADTMRRYQDTLAETIQRQTGRPPQPSRERGSELPTRGRDPIATPSGPAIELR